MRTALKLPFKKLQNHVNTFNEGMYEVLGFRTAVVVIFWGLGGGGYEANTYHGGSSTWVKVHAWLKAWLSCWVESI